MPEFDRLTKVVARVYNTFAVKKTETRALKKLEIGRVDQLQDAVRVHLRDGSVYLIQVIRERGSKDDIANEFKTGFGEGRG